MTTTRHTRILRSNGEHYECDDYRNRILSFVPEILTIIKKDSREDRLIQEAFLKRYIAMDRSISSNGFFEAEPCFFDILFSAEEGNQNDKHLFFFLNNSLKLISERLSFTFNAKLKTMVRNLIYNFDNEKSRLYSGIAEIAALCKILEAEELTLRDIEQKIPNGKSVDFVIGYNNEDFFIEVVSRSFDIGRINSEDGLYTFLRDHIEKKFNEKYQQLDALYLRRASLLPVLWGDLYNLKQYWEALLRIDKAYRGPLFPFYCLFHAGEKGYVFVPANDVFQHAKEQEA